MMKSYGLFGFLGFIGLSLVFALPARAEDAPHVFISEINWAGSQVSTADEWIELVNLGPTPVDVSHYVLTGVASSDGAIEIAEGTIIEPFATLVIANYALGDPKTSLLIAANLVTTALSLPNSALDILLTTPAGLVIDNYTDTGTPDVGQSNPAISVERDLTSMTWRSSTLSLNLSASIQLGTPGVVDLPTVANDPALAPKTTEPNPVELEPDINETQAAVSTLELPAPCTQVVLENVSSISSELISDPLQVAAEISPSLAAEVSSTPAVTSNSELEIPITAESNTLSVQKISPDELSLNELVSDPTDGIEWVEILNTTLQSIDLTGSSLEDAGAHSTPLPNVILAPGALVVIDNPDGNLNNTGDTLTLFDSFGSLIDTLTYGTTAIPAPQDGESLARDADGSWLITTATRNTNNLFPAPIEETEISDTQSTIVYETLTDESNSASLDSRTLTGSVEAINDSRSPGAEPIHRIVAIAKSVEMSPGDVSMEKKSSTQVVVTGTVVALPDTFGKQIMFLDGHEIYFHAADWPVLALGDIVQITGTTSTNNGLPRIKISSTDAIVVTGHNDLIPIPVDGSELATTPHGLLISIAGQVTNKAGSELSITTADGTVITAQAIKKTGLSWSSIQNGSIIVIGIAKHTDDGVIIAPRSINDIHFTPSTTLTPTQSPKTITTPIVGGGLLTGSIGALGTWYLRSRRSLPGLPF